MIPAKTSVRSEPALDLVLPPWVSVPGSDSIPDDNDITESARGRGQGRRGRRVKLLPAARPVWSSIRPGVPRGILAVWSNSKRIWSSRAPSLPMSDVIGAGSIPPRWSARDDLESPFSLDTLDHTKILADLQIDPYR